MKKREHTAKYFSFFFSFTVNFFGKAYSRLAANPGETPAL
jgi:hypothetical protein